MKFFGNEDEEEVPELPSQELVANGDSIILFSIIISLFILIVLQKMELMYPDNPFLWNPFLLWNGQNFTSIIYVALMLLAEMFITIFKKMQIKGKLAGRMTHEIELYHDSTTNHVYRCLLPEKGGIKSYPFIKEREAYRFTLNGVDVSSEEIKNEIERLCIIPPLPRRLFDEKIKDPIKNMDFELKVAKKLPKIERKKTKRSKNYKTLKNIVKKMYPEVLKNGSPIKKTWKNWLNFLNQCFNLRIRRIAAKIEFCNRKNFFLIFFRIFLLCFHFETQLRREKIRKFLLPKRLVKQKYTVNIIEYEKMKHGFIEGHPTKIIILCKDELVKHLTGRKIEVGFFMFITACSGSRFTAEVVPNIIAPDNMIVAEITMSPYLSTLRRMERKSKPLSEEDIREYVIQASQIHFSHLQHEINIQRSIIESYEKEAKTFKIDKLIASKVDQDVKMLREYGKVSRPWRPKSTIGMIIFSIIIIIIIAAIAIPITLLILL